MELTICQVYDENKATIQVVPKIIKTKHKYSNTEHPTYRILLDDYLVKKKDKYFATYKCSNCGRISDIQRIQNLLRRMRESKTYCYKCKEDNPEKRKKQSLFMKKHPGKAAKGESFSNPEKLTKKLIPDTNYYKKHYSDEDFLRFRKFVISVNNVPIEKLEYRSCVQINKNMLFPRFYNIDTNELVKPVKVCFSCSICGTPHTSKQLSGKIRKCSFLCQYCFLATKSFKVRKIENCFGETLTFQSKPEQSLIDFCNKHDILILDGPTIPYTWNHKEHSYRIDFYIPEWALIEIKGNHVWHRKQVESGQWEAKERAAVEYCQKRGLEYKLVFTNELPKLKDLLIRYSPTSGETQRSEV